MPAVVGLVVTWALGLSARASDAANSSAPNILLILADDLGFSDVGCYGSEIPTPNIDRLAANGLRFTQFYNCAVCTASRAALLTGLYPRAEGKGILRPDMVTLGETLRQAGYATALIGKWHLGSTAPRRPIDRGFDEFYGVLDGACNYFNPAQPDPDFYGGKSREFAHNETRLTQFPAHYYTTDAFSAQAAAYIEKAARAKCPFFLHLAYTAPHFPLHAPASDIDRHRGRYGDGYDVVRTRRYRRQIELGIVDPRTTPLSPVDHKTGTYQYDYEITPWAKLGDAARQREERRMEVYAAMVDRLDQGIGRVLAALDASGQAGNTIVLFMSDNGGCASIPVNDPAFEAFNAHRPIGDRSSYEFVGPGWGWTQCTPFRRYKTWTYEGGINTPLIVRWPGHVPAGGLTHAPGHFVDLMPTLLELAGATYPAQVGGRPVPPLEGQSLVATLAGKPGGRTAPMYWELFGNRAVREGDWKLVWGASDQRWELYQLASDRTETVNLAARHPERVSSLAAKWEAWARQLDQSSP